MNTTFRLARNEDAQEIQLLVFPILKEFGLQSDTQEIDSDLLDIEAHYINRGGIFKVLLNQDNHIIACYGLYKNNDTECELRKMYLQKTYRGQGLGKHMLDDAIREAKAMGFIRITLETASVLQQAKRLYESYGFQIYSPKHLSNRCDQAYYLDLR